MIRFSVIVPLYNKANFVRKTIESVLDQTFKDFEIIIVNDGSTDNSLAVVNEINDARIRIFSKENEGVSAARNFGIEKAQYEYIAFLDADDLWLPDYLETINEMIERYPQAGIFATSFSYIDHLHRKHDVLNPYLSRGEMLLTDNYCKSIINGKIQQLCTITTCVKKNLFDKTGGFRNGIKQGEDIDMWLRLSLVSPIIWKNQPKAIYNKITENNNASTGSLGFHEGFPYWEWYAYNSSIYLKFYTNRAIKHRLKRLKFKEKIYTLSKINWFYVLLHLFYICYKKIKN